MKPLAIDLFAGAGGTTLGLRRAGYDVRIAVDMDPYKASTLSSNHPGTSVLGLPGTTGDIRMISGEDLLAFGKIRKGHVALLVACPPCQGFSMQGNRNPDDERNGLYLEFLRLARETYPKAVAFENVPGIMNFHEGKVFLDLQETLHGMKYETEFWKLNSRDLGVPQARERVFIIGVRNGYVPEPPRRCEYNVNVWETIADLPVRRCTLARQTLPISYRCDPRSKYASAMRGRRARVANCEMTVHAPGLSRRIRHLKWGERDEATWHRRLHPHKPAPTITAGSRTRTACRPIHPFADRVLTVREGARLASFPDWYRFPPHKAEAWSQIGNCVPPLMAQRVFEQVRKCL